MHNRPEEREDRPWEEPGSLRRDFEPHRGGFLGSAAGLSFFLGLGSICFPPLGIIGLGFIVFVGISARSDLAKIQAGTMDPKGERPAKDALQIAVISLIFTLLIWLMWCIVVLNGYRIASLI